MSEARSESARIYGSTLSVQDRLYYLYRITRRLLDMNQTQDMDYPEGQYADIRRNKHDGAVASGFIARLKLAFGNDVEFAAMSSRVRAYRFQPEANNPEWSYDNSDDEDEDEPMTGSSNSGVSDDLFADLTDDEGDAETVVASYDFFVPETPPHTPPSPTFDDFVVPETPQLHDEDDEDDVAMATVESKDDWVHLAADYYKYASVEDYERNHHPFAQLNDPELAAETFGFLSVRDYLTSKLGSQRVDELDARRTPPRRGVLRERDDSAFVSFPPQSRQRTLVVQLGADEDDEVMQSSAASIAAVAATLVDVIDEEGDPDMITASFGPGRVQVECANHFCTQIGSVDDFISFQPLDNCRGSAMCMPDGSRVFHSLVFYCPRHAPVHGLARM